MRDCVFVGSILSRPHIDMLLRETEKMFNCDHYIYLPFRSNDQKVYMVGVSY